MSVTLPDCFDKSVWDEFKSKLPGALGDKIKKLNVAWKVIDADPDDSSTADLKKLKIAVAETTTAASKAAGDLEGEKKQSTAEYKIVAEMEKPEATVVFRKLSDQFEQCVVGLNWVKHYINDPFYQYMFREFQVI